VTVDAWGQPVTYAHAAQPSFASYSAPAPRPAVRTVYRERPAPTYRTATQTRTVARQPTQQVRSWKKSALIIGGSAAGGAAVGAVLDGKSGAKKGAIVGGVAGTVYDIATRNKTRY
jgi:outer membrane lipoprotein SlyB